MISVELERDDKLTVRQWEVSMARNAGAADDAPVAEVIPDGTDVVCGWRVQVSSPAVAELDNPVSMPAWLVQDLLRVVSVVAASDGDVRGLEDGAQTALRHAHEFLLRPVLGDSIYAKDDDEAEREQQG